MFHQIMWGINVKATHNCSSLLDKMQRISTREHKSRLDSSLRTEILTLEIVTNKTRRCGSVYLGVDVLCVCEVFPFQPLVYIRDLEQIDCVSPEKFPCDDLCGESASFKEWFDDVSPVLSVEISWVFLWKSLRKSFTVWLTEGVDRQNSADLRYVVEQDSVPSIKTLRKSLV